MEPIYFLGLSRPILHPQSHSPLKTGVGVPRQQKPSLSTRTLTLFLCLVNLSFSLQIYCEAVPGVVGT